MKVGLLTQWYEPEPGPAALPSGLARGLAARGHDVRVVTGFPNYPGGRIADGYRQQRRLNERAGRVLVRRVALYPSHDQSVVRRALNYGSFAVSALASGLDVLNDVDVLWVNYSPVTIGLPMLWHQRRCGTRVLLHVLDLWPDTVAASGLGGSRVSRVDRPLHGWCSRMYRAAGTVAYISPGVGEILERRGVPRAKLAYAPMWADESVHSAAPTPAERGWGLSPDTVALVYAGTIGGAQQLGTLIHACAKVRHLDLCCLIAGSGTREAELRHLAERLGANNVSFLGRLSPPEVKQLMAASDVQYIGLNDHPLARITMPSKVQAALASARPIVGSVAGDAAAVVRRAGGWVAKPGDVAGLASCLNELMQSGRHGLTARRERARGLYEAEFSFNTGLNRIEDILKRLAGERASV